MSPRHLILHNFWLKAFSLVLATLLWLAVYSVINEAATLPGFEKGRFQRVIPQVEVAIAKSATDTRLYKITPAAVDITLVGDRATLEALAPRELAVFVNLANMRYEERIHQVQVHAPAAVRVLDVSPGIVRIERISP